MKHVIKVWCRADGVPQERTRLNRWADQCMRRLARGCRHGLLCIALMSGVLQATWAAADPGFPLHFTEAETLLVDGIGFSAPPYSLDSAPPAGEWTPVTLPHGVPQQVVRTVETGQTLNPPTVIRWYRLRVPALSASPASATEPRYLYIARWKAYGQLAVYGDGRLLYQSHSNLLWNGRNNPLWIALDGTAGAVTPKVITVRLESLRHSGSALSSIWLGDEPTVGWRFRTRNLLQTQLPFVSSAAFLIFGLFAMSVWVRRQEDSLYLIFFLISVAAYLRTMHYYLGEQRLPVSDEWFGWITLNSLFWLFALANSFLAHLHLRQQPWQTRAIVAATAVISFMTLPFLPTVLPWATWLHATFLGSTMYVVAMVMGVAVGGLGLYHSRLAKSRHGIVLSSWGLITLLIGVYDWMQLNNHVSVEGSYLGSYGIVGIFLISLHIMFQRYNGAIEEVKHVNTTLAERLRAREMELTLASSRLREIAHRQTLSDERQRLTQDMHDGLGSSLVSALRVVEGGRMCEADVAEVLKGCIDDLKLAIDSMEPVEADLLLLLATLRFRLGPRLASAGIALRWEVVDVPALDWLDPRNALHILRILQEAFANILKHTQAHEIRVTTGLENGGVTVTIADNGQGFSLATALQKGGKGLHNQQRRAQSIGGAVRWQSNDHGTRMTLWLPEKTQASLAA
ncbi:ATP-binding protein [Rhodoferax sp.]|uniref:sensor histidine kinase n=1 Tax=Rhodoferax sp. TaxID=50421 RepID=UPI0025F1B2FC|nr:ATP-binding protein [Rhodoferax sp.]